MSNQSKHSIYVYKTARNIKKCNKTNPFFFLRTFTVVPSMFNHHVSSSHHRLDYQHVLRINVRTQAQVVIRKKLRYTVIFLEI